MSRFPAGFFEAVAGEEQKKQHDEARRLMDEKFGVGILDAHRILETDAGAKRIYDCAIVVIAGLLP